jgi:solute carrier family 34 (sodium-dependent phosphate cotransporter)
MDQETLPAAVARPAEPSTTLTSRVASRVWWTVRLLVALFVFVGALQVMKEGAASLNILSEGGFLVRNAGATLGLGWLGALLVLSGSPIAASALTLVAAGSISETQGFTMLIGSRLGAAFVVLVTAIIYASRGGPGERQKPVSVAVMALSTTALVYIPGSLLAYGLLQWETFQNIDLILPAQFGNIVDFAYGDLLTLIEGWPPVVLFLGGLGLLLLAFKLIDTVLPELSEEQIQGSRMAWLRRKWPMFFLGSLVALITMSVSVALTLLVPLVAKNYVRRDEIIPYIMGANIFTLGDTLMAAFLLESGSAVRIVLACMIGTFVFSVLLLAVFPFGGRKLVWQFQKRIVSSKPRLAAFTAGLFLIPVSLILVWGTVIG